MKQTMQNGDPPYMGGLARTRFAALNAMPRAMMMLVAAFILGLAIRLLFLGSKSIWLDEALSIILAADPKQLWASGFDSAHPPLYYTLLHYWLPLGESEFMLRLSSALVGSFAIPLSYTLAVGLVGRRVAYTTMWLMAFSPLLVWYAQELRSYSLLLVCGLLAAVALMHLVSRPKGWWWALFIIAMSAAMYTHYAALLLIAAQIAIIGVLYLQKRATRKGVLLWLLSWPVVALLYWPWLSSPGMRAFTKKMFTSSLYPIEMLAARLSISPTAAGLGLVLLALLAILTVLFTVFVMVRRGATNWHYWAESPILRYGMLILLIASIFISVIPRLYTVKKLVVAMWPYGLLVTAWIFPWKVSNRTLLILLLTTSLVGSLVNVTVIPKDQWREMAAYLAVHGEPTDSIWIEPRYHFVPLNYYFSHPNLANIEATSTLKFDTRNVSPEMSDAELANLMNKGQRVWLIYHAADFHITDPARRLEKWLVEHLEPTTQLNLYRIEATLYTAR